MKKLILALFIAFLAPQAKAVVPTTTNAVSYTGNGATTVYAVPFKVLTPTDLYVTISGVLQNLGSSYTVSLLTNSATVVFSSPPANTSVVTIIRLRAFAQLQGFRSQGPMNPTTVENTFDDLEMQIQQLNAGVCTATLGAFPIAADTPLIGQGIVANHIRLDLTASVSWLATQTSTGTGNTSGYFGVGGPSGCDGGTIVGGAANCVGVRGTGGLSGGWGGAFVGTGTSSGVVGLSANSSSAYGAVGTGNGLGGGVLANSGNNIAALPALTMNQFGTTRGHMLMTPLSADPGSPADGETWRTSASLSSRIGSTTYRFAPLKAGTVVLGSGTPSTATVSLPISNMQCVCTERTTSTNNGTLKCDVSGTTLTITGANTVTDQIAYICLQPN